MNLPNQKKNAAGRIHDWAQKGSHLSPVEWERMPEIYLYMDQVITYMQSMLSLFERSEETRLLTSSMINNYVKLRIVPAPVKKRYGRVHLAYLLVIGLLKQVLPIPDVKTLLESQFEGAQEQTNGGAEKRGFAKAFDCFCTLQETAFADMARQAAQLETAAGTRPALAMEMAVRANASKTLAEKLIALDTQM